MSPNQMCWVRLPNILKIKNFVESYTFRFPKIKFPLNAINEIILFHKL